MDLNGTSELRPLLGRIPGRHSPSCNGVPLENMTSPPGGDGGVGVGSRSRSRSNPREGGKSSSAHRFGGSISHQRWPWFIWLMLKVMGLYSHRRVAAGRRCHLCRLAALQRRRTERGEPKEAGLDLYPGAWDGESEDQDGGDAESPPAITCPRPGRVDAESGAPSPARSRSNRQTVRAVALQPRTGEKPPACLVCQSEWWDANGRYRPYSDADIGIRRWNHRGSAVLSVIWPTVLIAFIMFDFVYYLRDYWGRQQQVIRLISYSTFLLLNVTCPLMILVANVYNVSADRSGAGGPGGRGAALCGWRDCLGTRYIVKRLQHLGLGSGGLPRKAFMGVCLLWPCFNGAFRIILYYALVASRVDVHVQVSLMTGLVCMVVWGNFCYLTLLLRLSYQRQVRLELAFLWRHAGRLDECRRRMVLFTEELGGMCRLASLWTVTVVAVCTWAFTTQVSWDYLMISQGLHFRDSQLSVAINVLIWSENTMFLLLPLAAVGGMDLNWLWARYRRGISRMRSEEAEAFWDKVMAFCGEQSPEYRVKTVTLVLSAIGLYLGLHFGEQNVEYWTKGHPNTTAASLIPAPIMDDVLN